MIGDYKDDKNNLEAVLENEISILDNEHRSSNFSSTKLTFANQMTNLPSIAGSQQNLTEIQPVETGRFNFTGLNSNDVEGVGKVKKQQKGTGQKKYQLKHQNFVEVKIKRPMMKWPEDQANNPYCLN